jgi:hypothetical protein
VVPGAQVAVTDEELGAAPATLPRTPEHLAPAGFGLASKAAAPGELSRPAGSGTHVPGEAEALAGGDNDPHRATRRRSGGQNVLFLDGTIREQPHSTVTCCWVSSNARWQVIEFIEAEPGLQFALPPAIGEWID